MSSAHAIIISVCIIVISMCLVRLINPKYLPEVVILCLVISLAYYCAKEDSAPEELEDIPVSYAQHPYTKLSFHDKFMAMYTLKPGVKADNLISAMDTAAVKIAHCYRHVLEDYDYRPLVTSANDSRHSSRRSYHYRNAALDIRIRDLRWKERSQIMQCVHDSLDESRFYIRHEAIGTPLEHLHVHCFKY